VDEIGDRLYYYVTYLHNKVAQFYALRADFQKNGLKLRLSCGMRNPINLLF